MADRITNEQREAIVRKAVAERDAMLTDKADERGSAEPVARVVRRWPHYNLGVELISERPVKEGDQLYLRSDSAQARDAARYRFLRERLLGADFDWQESGKSAVVFEWPDGASISADCDASVDAAMQDERAVLAKNGLGGKPA
jgi:hypothetical protein